MSEIREEGLERRRPKRYLNVGSSTHQHHKPEERGSNPHAPGQPTGVDGPKDTWQSPRWPSNDDWKSPKFNDRVNRDKAGKFSHQWQSPRWKSKPSKDIEAEDTHDWVSPNWNDNLIKHDQLAPASGPPAAIRRKAYDMAMQLVARDAEFREEDVKRDQGGKFATQASSGAKPTEPSKPQAKPAAPGKHPGHGYSTNATVNEHGTIQTNNVRDAVRALYEGKKVELDQPRQVSTHPN